MKTEELLGWGAAVLGVSMVVGRMNQDKGDANINMGDVEERIRREAKRYDYTMPAYVPLAMAQVESNLKHLPSRGSGNGRTFYPFGIQRNRGADLTGLELGSEERDDALADLDYHIMIGVDEIARLWDVYGGDIDRVRVGWVYPASARKGPPYPKQMGSVLTSTRLSNWRKAVAKWGGPVVPVA